MRCWATGETNWYEIDASCADKEKACENRSCGRRHRNDVIADSGCIERRRKKKRQCKQLTRFRIVAFGVPVLIRCQFVRVPVHKSQDKSATAFSCTNLQLHKSCVVLVPVVSSHVLGLRAIHGSSPMGIRLIRAGQLQNVLSTQ
jgi:hypothetical protein